MYTEDDLLPISALQHLMFCPRQWALIHLEQVWAENRLTAQGRLLHDRVHNAESESRAAVRIVRGLRLRSLTLGLIGQADVVEFHRLSEKDETSCRLANRPGYWRPVPIEYKRGQPKKNACDRIQLCAQAMCLEEMLNVSIPSGMLFYGRTKRRKDVAFDDALRNDTMNLVKTLHEWTEQRYKPLALVNDPRCKNCSLNSLCMPKVSNQKSSDRVLRYVNKHLKDIMTQPPENCT